MIDSGATALFLDHSFIAKHNISLTPLRQPIDLYNIDGSSNQAGRITHFARLKLTLDGFDEWTDFLATNLGGENVILGLPWLRKVNPHINWQQGYIRIPRRPVTMEETPDPDAYSPGEAPSNGTILEEVYATQTENHIRIPSTPAPTSIPSDGDPKTAEEQPTTPYRRICANRSIRREWIRLGITEHAEDELWCAAGYTYSQRIAEEALKDKPTRTMDEMIPPQYRHHLSVFSEEESHRLPGHKPWDHAIDLIPGSNTAIRTKVYPMSANEQEELQRFLEENLAKGYIRPSKSPLSSPVFFIKKKDGKLRFVQDYRKLNEITVKNRYPLPLVSDIVGRLKGARYFTEFDVRWGYNNVRIKDGDEWKAAFATNQGLFEPLVMFFGLTNSPATFQALMNSIFSDLIAEGKVAVYLDDILIFTITLEEHRIVVDEVLRCLKTHDLYLWPEKCEFEQEKIEYLGLVIQEGEVHMDPSKVEAVHTWPSPKSL